jgi:hypothetical protein
MTKKERRRSRPDQEQTRPVAEVNATAPTRARFAAGWESVRRRANQHAPLVGLVLAAGSLVYVGREVHENTKATQVATRGQLYQTENGLETEEGQDSTRVMNSIWAIVPVEVRKQRYAETLLRVVSNDSAVIHAKSVRDLFLSGYGIGAFQDVKRAQSTSMLRKLFIYVEENLYHTHNAFDYRRDRILSAGEWDTWKGLLREMHAHPILLMAIYQGHQNRYFSREFGMFLREEVCGRPGEALAPQEARGCEFARGYYPDMFEPQWLASLATY